jgi:hypothetical protein
MSGMVGNTLSAGNQDSPIGAIAEPIQKWTDPLSWISGGKWADITSKDLPKATNQALQPIAQPINQFDQAVNPLRKIGLINNIANTAYAKPGDAIGLAIGSIATGGALDGALAGAGGGGAGAAGAAGAADAGLGAGLAADGAGSLAIGAPAASVGAADGLGTAGTFLGSGSGAGLGTGFGTTASATGSGITGGTGGFTGFMGGPAAFGDAGLTGGVSAGGSGLSGAMAGDLGGSLGAAPTGLFSGMLPGGGMTGTASGALGGGLSGGVAGTSSVGGAGMGGLLNNPLYSKLSDFAQNQAISQGMKMATPQQDSGYHPTNFSHASYHAPNAAAYTPSSAITLPYTLGSGGGAASLLQQMMQQRQNPLG